MTPPRPSIRTRSLPSLSTLLFVALAACVLPPIYTGSDPSTGSGGRITASETTAEWPVQTREHVDLWLHGFAVVALDTVGAIPLFRRDYRQEILAARTKAGITTLLDANRDQLTARFLANPNLVSAHFLALYFANWDELRRGVELFFRANGDPRWTNDPSYRQVIATINTYFPTRPDRDWLSLFMRCLEDERTRFYKAYWAELQSRRALVLQGVDSAWQRVHHPKLERFLRNSQFTTGALILSPTLEGEGRTLSLSKQMNLVAVEFPPTRDRLDEPFFMMMRELAGTLATEAVNDNTTPSDQRSGANQALNAQATMQAGAILLEKTSPALVEGYQRYYLGIAKVPVRGEVRKVFDAAFPIPAPVRAGIAQRIDAILAGI